MVMPSCRMDLPGCMPFVQGHTVLLAELIVILEVDAPIVRFQSRFPLTVIEPLHLNLGRGAGKVLELQPKALARNGVVIDTENNLHGQLSRMLNQHPVLAMEKSCISSNGLPPADA